MNKKIYMTPALQIVSVSATHMLAESLVADPTKEVNANFTKDEGDWDDDLWDD